MTRGRRREHYQWNMDIFGVSKVQDKKARVVQTLLFVADINTLLQTFLGTRLPAVIGGSYTFVTPTISIILAGEKKSGKVIVQTSGRKVRATLLQ